ncbi:hypothetical protein DITRI_Ditri02bG0019400 [Diplodiscus trichospermus]
MGSSRFILFFYSVVLSLATLTLSLDNPYFMYGCDQTSDNYTTNSTYQANLNRIVSQFSSLTDFNDGFFNLSAGESPDKVYTSALCRGDIDQDRCRRCLNDTATELEQFCPSKKAATAWSEFCLVRYANRDMYGLLDNDPRTCVYNTNNSSNPDQFNQTLSELLSNLRSKAVAGGPLKYATGNAPTGNLETVYAMVQCTPDMDEQNCTSCLNFAMNELQNCCSGKIGCRVLRPTCTLRFESNPFFNQTADTPSSAPQSLPPPSPPFPIISSPPTSTRGKGNKPTPSAIIAIASIVGGLIQIIMV